MAKKENGHTSSNKYQKLTPKKTNTKQKKLTPLIMNKRSITTLLLVLNMLVLTVSLIEGEQVVDTPQDKVTLSPLAKEKKKKKKKKKKGNKWSKFRRLLNKRNVVVGTSVLFGVSFVTLGTRYFLKKRREKSDEESNTPTPDDDTLIGSVDTKEETGNNTKFVAKFVTNGKVRVKKIKE
ncbi:MAG: hypothetical protein AAF443_07720, partial [Chlamydiota bacterium]